MESEPNGEYKYIEVCIKEWGARMTNRRWEREHLVQALSLYCQIPFGKIHARNPAVVVLSNAIDRTPSAVAMKLSNFASLDPELQSRGIRGMGNISALDRDIWAEYFGRWDVLAEYAVDIDPLSADEHDELKNARVGQTEYINETVRRRGQSFFRATVVAAHDGKCCITGITSGPLLRASHIIPWSHDDALRLDPRNGLCLNALHDAAFDRGLITLSNDFEMIVSDRLKSDVPESVYSEMFENRISVPIKLPERFRPATEFLEYHRNNIYDG